MIISIMPEYIADIGDCCRVKRKDGEALYQKKLNTVFREIFRNNFLDYCAIKKKTTSILNQKTLAPVYLSLMEILIPVKVRQPLFRGDCCYGYVNIFEIKKVLNKEILLKSGEKIAFLDTKRAIQRREFMAELLEEKLPGMVKPDFPNVSYPITSDIFGTYFLNLLQQVIVRNDIDNRNSCCNRNINGNRNSNSNIDLNRDRNSNSNSNSNIDSNCVDIDISDKKKLN
jgi:hypothetical protein